MGMSNYVMSLEDQFFDAAAEVVMECEDFEQFYDLMRPQLDLVKHMDVHETVNILNGIWNEYWSYYQ